MAYEPHICVYHADCPDGGAAAWAIRRRWPVVDLVKGSYNEELDFGDLDIAGKNILLVDFSVKAELLTSLVSEGESNSVIVLDHHRSAEAALAGLPILMEGDEERLRTVAVRFDMDKSGCRLAWEFAFPRMELPYHLQLIEDRDLWRFAFGHDTRRFAASLRTFDLDEMATYDHAFNVCDEMIREGEYLLPAEQRLVQKFLKQQYTLDFTKAVSMVLRSANGVKVSIAPVLVPAVNVPYHYSSEACHELLKQHPHAPFVVSWVRGGDGFVHASLRSQVHRMDVSKIAEQFGGGGHWSAAGFSVDAATF